MQLFDSEFIETEPPIGESSIKFRLVTEDLQEGPEYALDI